MGLIVHNCAHYILVVIPVGYCTSWQRVYVYNTIPCNTIPSGGIQTAGGTCYSSRLQALLILGYSEVNFFLFMWRFQLRPAFLNLFDWNCWKISIFCWKFWCSNCRNFLLQVDHNQHGFYPPRRQLTSPQGDSTGVIVHNLYPHMCMKCVHYINFCLPVWLFYSTVYYCINIT